MDGNNEIKFVQRSQQQYDKKDEQVILGSVIQVDPAQTADYKIKRNMDTMMGVKRSK